MNKEQKATLFLALRNLSLKEKEYLLKVLDDDKEEGKSLLSKLERAYSLLPPNPPHVPKDRNTVRASDGYMLIEKADYERDKHGNIIYRGEKFAGFNKPMRDGNGKQGKVLVKEGDKIKKVRFGDSKLGDNNSVEQNDRFYSRFGNQSGMNDKFSALYWSSRWLWPRGKMKGKGVKPFYTLKGGNNVNKDSALNIVKSLDEEEMIAIEPLYINVGESDAHEDGITDEQLDKLIDNFNTNINNIKGNIHHMKMVDGYHPVKAYRLPLDVYVGNPENPESLTKIPEGQPVVKVQFHKDELGKALWEKRKSGVLKGVSIGAKGRRVPNPDYEGE